MENPLEIVDKVVSSYAGGINTDEYYAKIYANEQNGVPTETLILEPRAESRESRSPQNQTQNNDNSKTGQTGSDTHYQQYYTSDGSDIYSQNGQQTVSESPIDVFLRTTVPSGQASNGQTPDIRQNVGQQVQVTAEQQQITAQTVQPVYTTNVGDAPKIEVTPTGAFGFIVHAAFSFAVVISVVGIMFVVYIIIRTRQLHHHEHHVKELGGHGAGHSDNHAAHPPAVSHTAHAPAVAHAAEEPHVNDVADEHEVGESEDVHVDEVQTAHTDAYAAEQMYGDVRGQDVDDAEDSVPPPVAPVPEMSADELSQFSNRLKTIKADAAGDDEDAWYTALMDVNLLLEDVLGEKGYEGVSVKEMLNDDEAKTLATRDVALEAEAQFQKLISGEELLTKDAIVALVNMYAKVCKELGVV